MYNLSCEVQLKIEFALQVLDESHFVLLQLFLVCNSLDTAGNHFSAVKHLRKV